MWDAIKNVNTTYTLLAFAFAGIFVVLGSIIKSSKDNKFVISSIVLVIFAILLTVNYFLYLNSRKTPTKSANQRISVVNSDSTQVNEVPEVNKTTAKVYRPSLKSSPPNVSSLDQYFYLNQENTTNLPHSIFWWIFFVIYSNWLLLIALSIVFYFWVIDEFSDKSKLVQVTKTLALIVLLIISSYANLLIQQGAINKINYNAIVVKTMLLHFIVFAVMTFVSASIFKAFDY